MTKPIKDMSKEELIWAIEGYAANARSSFDQGKDPRQTLSRIKSMINQYEEAVDRDEEATPRS